MRKFLLGLLLAGVICGPAGAMTKPDDLVAVILSDDTKGSSADGSNVKRYQKKWKDIKLSAQNMQKLIQYNQRLEGTSLIDQYRLAVLQVSLQKSGDQLVAAAYYGVWGNVFMHKFTAESGNNTCSLQFSGSGLSGSPEFFNETDQHCFRE